MADRGHPGNADKAASVQDQDAFDDPEPAAGRPNPLVRRGGELARVVGRRAVALSAALLLALRTVVLPRAGRWLLPRWLRLILTIGAGLLLCASFPPFNWWWAAVTAFALLAWVLTRPVTTAAGGLGYGMLFGLAFYLPLLPWISALVGAMPWVMLAAASACFPALFGLVAVAVRHLPGWPIWFAVLWAVQEWAKSTVPFGGFPWGVVGFGQTTGPLLPLVQLGGAPLLSAAIVLLGCSLTAIALEIAVWWPVGQPRPDQDARDAEYQVAGAPPAVVLPGLCICFVLFAAVAVWPQVRHSGKGSGNDPVITVAAVQGNVPRLGLDFNSQRRAVLDLHVRETFQLADDIRAGTAPKPQFVIWPENSSDLDPLINPDAAEQITTAAGAVGVPILVGTILDVPVADGSVHKRPKAVESAIPDYTNTVIVWDPVTGPGERHNKQIVQPFGEYLPWPWLFRHLSGYADRAGHMVPGRSTGVVHPAGVPVGIATCWEVVFDRALRESVLHGAQMLAVPTNNATFNKTMSEQQLAFARARAVEHDRYVVVAGTTGISAVIAPDGVELDRTDFFVPAYLDTQLRLKTTLTPATRWGPAVQWVFLGIAIVVLSIAIRHHGRFPGRFTSWFSSPNRRRKRSVADSARPVGGQSDPPAARDDAEPPPDRRAARSRVPDADTDPANEGAT
jgi:apolipoprotein N-acyltransferase